MILRDDLIEAGVHACPIAGVDGVEDILDAVLGVLVDRATPLYDAGGVAPAYYIDDEPDEDTIWVVDLAVLRGDTLTATKETGER